MGLEQKKIVVGVILLVLAFYSLFIPLPVQGASSADYAVVDYAVVSSAYPDGVVAANSLRPIHQPGGVILIQIGILNDKGYPVDATIKTTIVGPSKKSFHFNNEDLTKKRTGVYELRILSDKQGLTELGEYTLTVQVKGQGVNAATQNNFFIKEEFAFDIIRDFPVSIDPWSGPTALGIRVIPFINVSSYDVTEHVPQSFDILNASHNAIINNQDNTLIWRLTRPANLRYLAQSELVSPEKKEFYLGINYTQPNSTKGMFTEARDWQMAIDALCFGDEYDFATNSNVVASVGSYKCKPCASETATDPTAGDTNGAGEMNDLDFETGGSIGKLKASWKGTGNYEFLRVDTGIAEGLNILNNEITLRIVGADFKEDKTQCGGTNNGFNLVDSVNMYVYTAATTVNASSLKTISTNFFYQEPGACTTSPTSCYLDSLNLSVGDMYASTPTGMNFTLRVIAKDTTSSNLKVSTVPEVYVQYQIDEPANITTTVSVSNATLEEGLNNTFSATCSEPNGQTFQLIVCAASATTCDTATSGANLLCNDSLSTSTSQSCTRTTVAGDVGTNTGDVAVCCDVGGLCDATNESVANWTVRANQAPQVLSLDAPPNATTIDYSPVLFNYTPSDNFGLDNCSLWTDWGAGWSVKGTTASPVNGSPNSISIPSIPAGNFVWNVQCFDLVENNGWHSTNYSLTVLEIPQITLINPIDDFGTSDTNITFDYNISGTLSLINCSLYLDSTLNQTNTSIAYNTTESFSVNFSGQGAHDWYVTCTNNQDSVGTSTTRTVSIDNEAPTSTINDPANATATSDTTPPINITLTDSVDSTLNYTIFVDDTLNKQGTVSDGVKTQIILNTLSAGSHQVIAQAQDDAGFTTNSTALTLSVDNTLPNVTLIAPGDLGTIFGDTVIFEFKFADEFSLTATCDLTVDGTVNQSSIAATNGTTTQTAVFGFSATTHTWNVSCTDEADNVGVSATRSFTIDLTPQGLGFGEDVPVPANGYSEGGELFRMCTDAACSSAGTNFVSTDTVHMQMIGPNDLGTGNKNKFFVYNGSAATILRTGSWTCGGGGGSDGTWSECNVSFVLGLPDGWYYIESDIEDAAKTRLHREFTTFTVGATQPVTGLHYKFFNDAAYTRQDDTFFNGDEVYVEISALPNLTMNTAKTKPTLTDFHKVKVKDFSTVTTYDSLTSPYRFHFTMTNNPTAGRWYFLEVKLEDAAKVKIGAGKQGRMLIYESNVQPNITDFTYDPILAIEESNVTFIATYDDGNIANRHIMRVCSTNSRTGTVCTGTELCSSTEYLLSNTINNPRSCQYPVTRTTPENNTAYVFVCDNKDSCSAMSLLNWDVLKDHVLPTITLNSPANASWFNTQNTTFNYTPSDASNIANCSIYLDAVLNQSSTTITNGSVNTFIINDVSEGTHTWNINCTDNSSLYNTNISETRTFSIDLTTPTSVINAPANNSYTNDTTPDFNVTATDNMDDPEDYAVFIDDSSSGQQGTLVNNTLTTVILNTLSENIHTILFEVTDEAGNKINSTERTITIDVTASTITVVEPVNKYNSSTAGVAYNYSITDALSPNASCEQYVNGALNRTDVINSTKYLAFTTTFSEGYHNWSLTCTDLAGNIQSEALRNLTVDLTSPIVSLQGPANNTLNTTSNNIDFIFNTTDAITNIENCSLVINDVVSPPHITTVTEGANTTEQRSLVNGDYLWYVNCTDTVSRVGQSDTYNLSINVIIDLDPPVVVLDNPINDSYLSNTSITLLYTATDAGSSIENCSLYLDGLLNTTDFNVSNGNQSNFTIGSITDAAYTWSVSCIDNSTDNEVYGVSENRTFIIDTTSPGTFTLGTPDNNTYTTNTSPTFFWTEPTEINFKNYTLQLSDTADFSYSNISYTITNKSTLSQATSGLNPDTPYYWRVIAYDLADNSRISTVTKKYITDNTLPLAFDITTPTNATVSTDRTPLLQWSQGNDTNFDNYTIEVSTNSSFATLNYVYNTFAEGSNSFQVVIPWTDDTMFFWRVTAYDLANNSRVSSTFEYTTDNIFPTAFTLTSPVNDTHSSSTSPNVTWGASTETNFANYTVEFSTDSAFSYTNNSFNTFAVNTTSVVVSGLVQNTAYFWRTLAYDKANHQTISTDYFQYTTDNTSPIVSLESPANNTLFTQSLVNFQYNVSENFAIENCSLLVDSVVEDTSTTVSIDTSQLLTATLTNGDHDWFIRCYDKADNSDESEHRNVSINVIIPSKVLNETSTSSFTDTTALINLDAQDGTQNQVDYFVTQTTLVNMANATSSAMGNNGFLVPTTAAVSFSGDFADGQGKGKSFITWKLYKKSGGTSTLVCKDGFDSSGGTAPPKNQGTITGSCSPAQEFTLSSTDTFVLTINAYNADNKNYNMVHYWDNTVPSWVQIEGYDLGFVDTNITSPVADPQPAEQTNFTVNCTTTCNSGFCFDTNVSVEFNTSSQPWQEVNGSGNIVLAGGESNAKSLGEVNGSNFVTSFSLLANTPSVNNIRCSASSTHSTVNGSVTTQITVRDVTVPTITLGNPVNNSWVNYDNITYFYTPNDNVGIANCSLIVNDVTLQTDTSITLAQENNITQVTSNGNNAWGINCTDTSGNTGSSSTQKIINVDTIKPTTNITVPSNNTYTQDTTPQITFTTNDNLDTLLDYEIIVDGSSNGQSGTIANASSTNLNLSTLTQGSHTTKINTTDEATNANFSNELTIIIDTQNPSLTVYHPPDLFETASSSVLFNYSYTDDLSPNASCDLVINDVINSSDTLINATPFNQTISFAEGYHNWSLNCNDLAANTGSIATRDFTVDLSTPIVNLETNPVNEHYENDSNTIEFFFNTTDAITTITSCSFLLNDSVNGDNKTSPAESTSLSFNRTISNGNYFWSINCTDDVSRVGSSVSRNITINVTNDLEPPVTVLNYPSDMSFVNQSNVNFLYTPTDALSLIANCSLYLNSTLNVTDTNVTNDVQNNFSITGLAQETHSWYVNCTDTSTNVNLGPSSTQIFTIDTTNPAIFNLSAPVNHTVSENNTPVMSWTQTSDVNFNNYTVEFSTVSNFSSINPTYSTNDSTNTSVATVLTNNTFYYWRVIAYDKAGNSRIATQTFEYVTDNINPTAFDVLTPANNTFSSDNTPTLTWEQTSEANFDNYTIQVTTDITFATIDNEYNTFNVTNNSFNITTSLTNDTTHYWRVIAYDEANHTTFSTNTFTYNLDNTLPLVFDLSTPIDNTESTDRTPLLAWGDAFDANFDNYTILVSTSPTFAFINHTYLTSPFLNTSHQVITPWADNTQFYWKVETHDAASNVRNSTSTFDYITDNIFPQSFTEGPVEGFNSTEAIVQFTFNVSDTNTIINCSLLIDDVITSTKDTVIKNTTQTIDGPVSNGVHNWSIDCTDGAGNINGTENRTINQTVDIPLLTYYESSTIDYTSTASISLGSKDTIENKITKTIAATSLYTMSSATGVAVGGNGLLIMPQTTLSFSGSFDATFANDGYVTWKLYKQNGTDNLICQSGDDNTGGEQITSTSKNTYTGSCTSPNSNYRVEGNDNFKLVVNIYNSRTSAQTFRHYWDGPGNSFATINAYIIGNKQANMTVPTQNLLLNETETFTVSCNTSCSDGACINVKPYVQTNTTGGAWQDISTTGNIVLNGTEQNGKSAGTIDNNTATVINYTLKANLITTNLVRCQARSDYTQNENTTNQTVQIFDHTPPNIPLNNPINEFNTTLTEFNFSWTPTDNYYTNVNCSLSVDGTNYSEEQIANGTLHKRLISNVTAGFVYWNVTCYDTRNNTNTSSTSVLTILNTTTLTNSSVNVTNSSLALTWSAVEGATSYNVYFKTAFTDNFSVTPNVTGITDANWTDFNHNSSAIKYYKVTPVRGSAEFTNVSNIFGKSTVQLIGGAWHLISFPFQVTNNNLGNKSIYGDPISVSPPNAIKSIFKLNPITKLWESVDYRSWGWEQSIGSPDFLILKPNESYWFEMNNNATMDYTGVVVENPGNVSLISGWNLVVPVYNQPAVLTAPESGTYPFTVTPINSIDTVFGYNSTDDTFTSVVRAPFGWLAGSPNLAQVEPNEGYYAWATQNLTWEVGR